MSGIQLAPGDVVPPSGQYNEAYQRDINSTLVHELRMVSSAVNDSSGPTGTGRTWAGIRFPVTPAGLNKDTLRSVYFQILMFHNFAQFKMRIYGHKVANSAPFTQTTTGIPKYRAQNEHTTAYVDIQIDGDIQTPIVMPYPDKFYDIFHEIMSVPGWTEGNPITLLFQPFDDIEHEARLGMSGGTNGLYTQSSCFVGYGPTGDDPITMDLYILGDSWAAFYGQSGFRAPDVSFPLFPNVTFHRPPAGLSNGQQLVGANLFGAGDMVRGYTPNGLIQDAIEDYYGGDDNVIITRHQHAAGGTRLLVWAAQASNHDGGMWGSINNPGTLRYNLAHPTAFSGYQIVWISLGGNDVLEWGGKQVGALLTSPWDNDEYAKSNWQILTDQMVPAMQDIVDEVFRCVPDPDKCWIVLPGYANFCIRSADQNVGSPVVFANSNAQDVFCQVHSIQGYNWCAAQWQWDTMDSPVQGQPLHPPYDLASQSALVQFTGDYQKRVYPNDVPDPLQFNINANSFPISQYQVNFPFPQGPLAISAWNYRGRSGWREGMKNIHDVTANARMKDSVVAALQTAADNNKNVVYLDCWRALPVDTVLSHDPASEHAQSPASLWVEGVHLNDIGATQWLNAPTGPIAKMDAAVGFLPGFIAPAPGEQGDPSPPPPGSVPGPDDDPGVKYNEVNWKFVVGEPGPNQRLLSGALQRNLVFSLKEQSSVGFKMNMAHDDIRYIAELETPLRILYRGSRVFIGVFGPSTDSGDDKSGYTDFAAIDYRGRLERFFVNDFDNTYWYGEDVATIVANSISMVQQRAGGDMGIILGQGFPTLGRTRQDVEFQPGDNFYASINNLAQSKELGFDWDIDYDKNLNLWLARGTTEPKQIEGRGRISSYTRNFNTGDFANAARVSGDLTVIPELVENPGIVDDPRGRWELQLSWPDAETQEMMSDRGAYMLEQVNIVPETYTVKLRKGWWKGPLHVWLGDVVTLTLRYGQRLNVHKNVRVQKITVDLGDNGEEDVEMELK